MELTNEFLVPLPPAEAWEVLTDLERIAPCLPGVVLTGITGVDHWGEVKVKVGPITATYKGVARLAERDTMGRRAVLQAEGNDARQGDATATLTATLAPEGNGTRVSVVSDITVGGRVGQFGRGVLADVSVKLIDEFASCLDAQLEAEKPIVWADPVVEPPPVVNEFAAAVVVTAPAGADAIAEVTPSAGPRRVEVPDPDPAPEPIDPVGAAAAPVGKRLAPVGLAAAAALVVLVLLRRRRR